MYDVIHIFTTQTKTGYVKYNIKIMCHGYEEKRLFTGENMHI